MYRTKINNQYTLVDIIPTNPTMLIVGKTPMSKSIEKGHWFTGRQGTAMWNKLRDHGIMKISTQWPDDSLINNNFGITDVVKNRHETYDEPTEEEYIAGFERLQGIINEHQPRILFFVYKRALDSILNYCLGRSVKSNYGFNPDLIDNFNAKVFLYPAPGTGPVTKEMTYNCLSELAAFISILCQPS